MTAAVASPTRKTSCKPAEVQALRDPRRRTPLDQQKRSGAAVNTRACVYGNTNLSGPPDTRITENIKQNHLHQRVKHSILRISRIRTHHTLNELGGTVGQRFCPLIMMAVSNIRTRNMIGFELCATANHPKRIQPLSLASRTRVGSAGSCEGGCPAGAYYSASVLAKPTIDYGEPNL